MRQSELVTIDLHAVLADVTYKPGVRMTVYHNLNPDTQVLEIAAATADSRGWQQLDDPRHITIVHRTIVPTYALQDEQHAIAFIRQCLVNMEVHELDEWIRYRGEQLRNPHEPGDTFAMLTRKDQ
jgi:hypothetical protein